MPAKRVDIGEIAVNAELSGPDGAPVVVLHHCFAANHGYWDEHRPAFDGYRMLRYDARGHGASDAPPGPYTLEMLAGDMAGLMDAFDVDRAHVCGVSLGGQVAQTFALAYPERLDRLMLVNTTCEYTDEQTDLWRARAAEAKAKGMDAVTPALMRRWFTDEAAEAKTAGYRFMEKAIRAFSPASFEAASEAMCMLGTTPRLPEIQAKTLVVGAPEDPGAPKEITELMARLIPNARLEWLHPARHLSSLEHPEAFDRMIAGFLAEPA